MIPAQITIGPIKFHLYGSIIAIAILAGWYLAKKRGSLYQIPQRIFDDSVLLIPLVLSLIGARIYHVADYWKIYGRDPISILFVWNGGLGIWGAIAGAILGFWLAAKIKKLDLRSVLDLAAPSILLGQAVGRIGNFVNQEGFGPPTNLPWGVYISPDRRPDQFALYSHFHPTFFYEAILNAIFFIILLASAKRFKIRSQVFALYLIFYSLSRFITEFWRIDTWTIGTIKVAHALAITVFLIGILLFLKTKEWKHS